MRSLKRWALVPTGTGATGASLDRPAARRHRVGRIAGTAITAMLASTLAPGVMAPAFADTPPATPKNIEIFPNRDFVGVTGYVGEGTATFTVRRNGVISGRAEGTLSAEGDLEVNHPGGVAWGTGAGAPNVTPNIKAGDVVSVVTSGGSNDSAVTQGPAVTGFTRPDADTIVVTGVLRPAGATAPNLANIEQRIINPDLVGTDVTKRDVRAVPGPLTPAAKGGYSSSLTFGANTFTATYDFILPATADIAAAGQMRALTWMFTDAGANRQGMTLAEFGETGGPGIGGGPLGPENTVPNAPANVGGIRGVASLTATWSRATTIPDGSPVTGYVVEVENALTGAFFRKTVLGATTRSVDFINMTNGTAYNISVRATSLAGPSLEGLGGPVTPSAEAASAPGTPTIGTATRGNVSASVRWTPSAFDSGSTVTGYSVMVVNGSAPYAQVGLVRTAAAGATSLTVSGLTNGTSYRFQVQAKNAIGTSGYSARSNAVTSATKAGAPRIGTASSGIAGGTITATARWSQPTSNGGSAITAYVVTVLKRNTAGTYVSVRTVTRAPLGSPLTMTLAAGSYRFTVKARNAVGLSASSARSNAVIAR